jgi:hypothetical protein
MHFCEITTPEVTLIKSNSNLGAEYGEVCHMKKFQ